MSSNIPYCDDYLYHPTLVDSYSYVSSVQYRPKIDKVEEPLLIFQSQSVQPRCSFIIYKRFAVKKKDSILFLAR